MIDRSSVRWGFVLILLALLGAFFIPQASIPRLALSAHTVGLVSGLLLIVFGLLSSHLALSATLFRGTRLLWIYSGFANWLGCFYGAWAGAGTMTPVASAGSCSNTVWAESTRRFQLTIIGTGLSYHLRKFGPNITSHMQLAWHEN